MKKDPRVYLAQILERVERILSFTGEGKGAFLASPLLQDAVIRNLEVIGEAAKRVPDEFRGTHPSIPWKGLAALRDVLIHQYEGVNLEEVWRIVENELPALQRAISSLLPPLERLERELGDDDDR
ncbi:MAG: DUF86 domain-containing protein [Thermodesulfobacteriota bacterium]